jgi:hypothetical protein
MVFWQIGSVAMWWYGTDMPYELLYWPAADEALDKLENDPAIAPARRAVDRTLQRLAADPFSPRLGTTAFITEELGAISATPAGLDNWYVLWQRGEGPRTIEIVLVHELRR